MREHMKHDSDAELIQMMDRCVVELKRLKANPDDGMLSEAIDDEHYHKFFCDEFGNEADNEYTEYCLRATPEEMIQKVIQIINKEQNRRSCDQS